MVKTLQSFGHAECNRVKAKKKIHVQRTIHDWFKQTVKGAKDFFFGWVCLILKKNLDRHESVPRNLGSSLHKI